MEVIFAKNAKEDLEYWQKKNSDIAEKILLLIEDIKINHFKGIGKPEALKFEKSGWWSRRINHEHRLVYKIANNKIYIAQCRFHN